MDIIEAIAKRISCRAFENTPIEQEKLDALANEIALVNKESGLNFQLYGPREDGFVIEMNAKMFSGNPQCYAAFVAPEGPIPEEKMGYYGEGFVLLATQLGLGTCWVASTYNRETTRVQLNEGEVLHDVVPIGYAPEKMPLKQRTIRKGIRARSKKPEDMWQGPTPLAEAPEWIQACIDAVCKAPSAINEQPVVFVQEKRSAPIRAKLTQVKTGKEYTDLGIAKLHFELTALECGIKASWEWGEGGAFKVS